MKFHNFKPGDRVICIRADGGDSLHIGKEYIVHHLSGDRCIGLVGVNLCDRGEPYGYYATKFRLWEPEPITASTWLSDELWDCSA